MGGWVHVEGVGHPVGHQKPVLYFLVVLLFVGVGFEDCLSLLLYFKNEVDPILGVLLVIRLDLDEGILPQTFLAGQAKDLPVHIAHPILCVFSNILFIFVEGVFEVDFLGNVFLAITGPVEVWLVARVVVLFLVQHPVGCFLVDVALEKLVGDDSFVLLPEFSSVVGDLEEAEEGLVHFPIALVGAPGWILRNGLILSDQLQSQHLVEGEGVKHHGLLAQEVELPLGPLEDRIHPGDKFKFCEIEILYFPFEVLSLGRLVHPDRLLGLAFLGGFVDGVEVLLPPGHVVEDAVGD